MFSLEQAQGNLRCLDVNSHYRYMFRHYIQQMIILHVHRSQNKKF